MEDLHELFMIVADGFWDCPCGNRIEPDGRCGDCGRNSPLIDAGMI
jgi:hypothetical protein